MIWAGLVTLVVGAAFAAFSAVGPDGSGRLSAGVIVMVLGGLMLGVGLVRRHRNRTARRAHGTPAGPGRLAKGGPRTVTGVRDAVYRTSRGRIAAMIAAAVYIISPIDLIPDILLPVGIVDDATALGWLVFAVSREYGRRRARSPQPMTDRDAMIRSEDAPKRREQRITPPPGRPPR